MHYFGRRGFIKALAIIGLTAFLPKIALSKSEKSELININQFAVLCALLCNYNKIDQSFVASLYKIVQQEPWGAEHATWIYEKIFNVAQNLSDRSKIFDKSVFTEGENWFVSHLLTTIFTGIYYHDRSRVISYDKALMHDAFNSIRPTPGRCGGPFGFWSDIPS